MKALKPCPFCGSDDIRIYENTYEEWEDFSIQCNECGLETFANTGTMPPRLEELIEKWNRRDKHGRH